MTLDAAKARLDPGEGESTGYVSPSDLSGAFDDLQDAWQTDDAVVSAAATAAQIAADNAQDAADAAQADATAALAALAPAGLMINVAEVAGAYTRPATPAGICVVFTGEADPASEAVDGDKWDRL